MLHEIHYNNLVIGKEYICKCYSMINKLEIKKIEKIGICIFVLTNNPVYSFQVLPNKVVTFYDDNDDNLIFNNIKYVILQPYILCPITMDYFENGDKISIIDDRFIFKKKELEDQLKQKYVNPLTNIEIKETNIKHYTVIIL